MMGFAVFSVRAVGDPEAVAALNRFLAGHKVLQVDRKLVEAGGDAYWTFSVEYLDGGKVEQPPGGLPSQRVDYKEVLSPAQFERFSRLWTKRKELAEAEGLPVFALFTNEQLAQIARMEKVTLSGLRNVDGLGEKKCGKYGQAIVDLFAAETDSTRPEAAG
jgi:superfamily II DNA helicase RecQ